MAHRLAQSEQPLSLHALAGEAMILYPRQPRPSYADQVSRILQDHGIRVRVAHEARELQIAIGLVAAEEGICIVPESVRKSQMDGVRYCEIAETATSPIIMSYRAGDSSPELAMMAEVIQRMYEKWGYEAPEGVLRLAVGQD
jgi:DNA-binding transcriptional LysR family regulator